MSTQTKQAPGIWAYSEMKEIHSGVCLSVSTPNRNCVASPNKETLLNLWPYSVSVMSFE